MPLLILTVNDQTPALEKQTSEVALIARALALAAHEIHRNGGAKVSGDILTDGAVVLGNWVYTPQSSS